jgi:hypothetical protein
MSAVATVGTVEARAEQLAREVVWLHALARMTMEGMGLDALARVRRGSRRTADVQAARAAVEAYHLLCDKAAGLSEAVGELLGRIEGPDGRGSGSKAARALELAREALQAVFDVQEPIHEAVGGAIFRSESDDE